MKPWIGLILGLVIGYVAQRSRYCIMGAFRDLILFKDIYLFKGYLATVLVFALVWVFGVYHHAA